MARLIDTSPNGPLPDDKVIGSFYDEYGPEGLDDLMADIEGQITQYLHHDVRLSVFTEEGYTELIISGEFGGRYAFEVQNYPLVPGPASSIFQQISFNYAAAYALNTQSSLNFCSVQHETGEVWALSPGMPEGLAGIGIGNGSPNILATGYNATYAGGWATGINDPKPNGSGTGATFSCTVGYNGAITGVTVVTPGTGYVTQPFLIVVGNNAHIANLVANLDGSGGIESVDVVYGGTGYSQTSPPTIAVDPRTSFKAKPIPPQIPRAALFLLREAVLMEDNMNSTAFNAAAGGNVSKLVDGSQEIEWQRTPTAAASTNQLGYQTPLAIAAERKLLPFKRRRPIFLM